MQGVLAHIIEAPAGIEATATQIAVVAVAGAFVAWLVVADQRTKHGRVRCAVSRRALGVALALTTGALVLPATAASQERAIPVGLPDLVSEPPIIWFDRIVTYDDGTVAKVMAFDGYLHNIGEGMLDLQGNPQEPGGVTQRWFDGDDWVEVAQPPVKYETSDDHNHFHLMAAAEYELWNEARTQKVGDSAKVGFCLLDTEQLDARYDAFYDIDDTNYCGQNDPDATELRMGITPGWVDTYDANTTLQWVDVSNVPPGRYWVAAIMDPDDVIVESNEDNNGHVFSRNHFPVSGHVARSLPMQRASEPIVFKADSYGTVGAIAWSIVEAPRHGTLSVPEGVDIADGVVQYTPDEGFDGVDSFSYVASDVNSPYPHEPHAVVVEVDAGASSGQASGSAATGPAATSTETDSPTVVINDVPEQLDVLVYDAAEVQFGVSGDGVSERLRFYGTGLPAGFTIDAETGRLSGSATTEGSGSATIAVAVGDVIVATATMPWTVERPAFDERPPLDAQGDISSPRGDRANLYVGGGSPDALYMATGLPEGVRMVENIPLISGDPSESGVFEIEVTETIDGEVRRTSTFVWTIRPGPHPEFPL